MYKPPSVPAPIEDHDSQLPVLSYNTNKKSPRGIRPRRCCPSPWVQNILRPLKIRALTCVVKDATSICLAEQTETGGLGQVTARKNQNRNEKIGYY